MARFQMSDHRMISNASPRVPGLQGPALATGSWEGSASASVAGWLGRAAPLGASFVPVASKESKFQLWTSPPGLHSGSASSSTAVVAGSYWYCQWLIILKASLSAAASGPTRPKRERALQSFPSTCGWSIFDHFDQLECLTWCGAFKFPKWHKNMGHSFEDILNDWS
jgi:hypothetical protein